MEAVVVPAAAGVLSALGLAAGDERRDRVVSHVRPLGEVGDLPPDGEADLRYRGQSFELAVALGDGLAERFPPGARGALRLRRTRAGGRARRRPHRRRRAQARS